MTYRLLIRQESSFIPLPHLHCGVICDCAASINEEVMHDLKSIRSLNIERVIIQTTNTPREVVERHERVNASLL